MAMIGHGSARAFAVVLLLWSGSARSDSWPGGSVPTGDGTPNGIAIAGNGLVVAGYDSLPSNGEWRLERRLLGSGELDPTFSDDGVVTNNPTFNWDIGLSLAVDGTYAYVVGYDEGGGFASARWRIEKRSLADGTLAAGFGAAGTIVEDVGEARAAAIAGTDLYVVGDGYRIERRRTSDGALVAGFGTGGVVTDTGEATAVAVAGGAPYVGGTPNWKDWRVERRNATTGAVVWSATVDVVDVGCGPQGVFALAADTFYLYVVGSTSGQWRIERRRLADGGLVYTQAFPGSGSCDAGRAIAIDATAMYVAGVRDGASRLEKRLLDDGTLVATFGASGAVVGPRFDLFEPTGIVRDGSLLYIAGSEFEPIAGTAGRIERRDTSTGALVPGPTGPPTTTTTVTTTTVPTTTTTTQPGTCTPMRLDDCRVRLRFTGAAAPRDRFDVRCAVHLGAASNGIDPVGEGVRFSLTDADSPVCTTPCFAETVVPRRRGRCWTYSAKASAGTALGRLKICDVDPARGEYTLLARSSRANLQCLNTAAPFAVDLTIGDDCTTNCGQPVPTTTVPSTTTVPASTTTTLPGCHTVSAFPTAVGNAPPNTDDWLSPDEARVTDDRTALVRLSWDNPSSYLEATGFGFALPPTARVDGITLTLVRAARDPGSMVDEAIRLVKDGVIQTTDRSQAGPWTPFYTAVQYGGPSDRWATTWTAADVDAATFGAAVRTRYTDRSGNNDAGVDSMMLTIAYCD